MIFRQFIHDDLGCASYFVGDQDAGLGAVVDPRLAVEEYLDYSRYVDARIAHVLETHTHADHVSGHGRLASATGATIHVNALAEAEYPHEAFDDGWVLDLGDLRIRAVHTPGHRPEHTAFLLTDTARGEEPWAVLTGDTLFVGDVARPDLAVEREEGARAIFRSLRGRLLALAPETEVWPGHLGGSLCGGPGMDMKVSSTIGYERRHNQLLGLEDESEFVEQALAGLGPQPPNFRNIVALNRGPLMTDDVLVPALSPREVEERRAAGALLVDVRTDVQFDDAHIPGAVSIAADHAGFGTKLAWMAEPGGELVVVGRDEQDARRGAGLAAAVGMRGVAGVLAGGMTGWRVEGREIDRTERLDVHALHDRLGQDPELQILDVREADEWEEGHIPGSVHRPYHDLDELPGELEPGRPVAVICASGQRSAVASSMLRRLGAQRVLHVVDGGVPTWHRAGYGIEGPAPVRGISRPA